MAGEAVTGVWVLRIIDQGFISKDNVAQVDSSYYDSSYSYTYPSCMCDGFRVVGLIDLLSFSCPPPPPPPPQGLV